DVQSETEGNPRWTIARLVQLLEEPIARTDGDTEGAPAVGLEYRHEDLAELIVQHCRDGALRAHSGPPSTTRLQVYRLRQSEKPLILTRRGNQRKADRVGSDHDRDADLRRPEQTGHAAECEVPLPVECKLLRGCLLEGGNRPGGGQTDHGIRRQLAFHRCA